MKNKLFLSLLLVAALTTKAYSQTLEFPYDTSTVNLDGLITMQEWQNAAEVKISSSGSDTVRVLYRHDMTAMYFAFMGKLESANALFPEILLDPQNQHTASWVAGQWWFHVSATDCENNGAYGVYNNCLVTQPGWAGVPNMVAGGTNADSIEIRIPFSKIGFNPATDDTVGISMLVTNTMNIFQMFPQTADRNIPSTWAQAVFSKIPASVNDHSNLWEKVVIAPNPASDQLLVEARKGFTYEFYDMNGKMLEKGIARDGKRTLKLAHLAPAIYIVRLTFDNGKIQVMKFQKE